MVKRKDGLWQQQINVIENGKKRTRYFYGKTKTEVLQKISAYREKQKSGLLFADVAALWWEEAESTLAPNSTKNYKPALKRAIEHFENTYINTIKPTDISKFLREFIKETKAADKTARTQLMIINLICRYGVENGYLEINPARDVTVPKGLNKTKRLMPTKDDIQKVKNSFDKSFGAFAYWIMYTGCRRGELLALTWEDVDIKSRTITINKSVYQVNNTPNIKSPKTASGVRTLPLMRKLLEKIEPCKKGIVFPDPKTGSYMTEDHYQKLWETYQKESGVTCTAHQLRHAYATMLFEAGVDPKDAQELLGHAQLSTTMDIYTEIRETRKQKVREKLLDVDIM